MHSFLILLKDNLIQALKSKKAVVFLTLYLILFSLVVYAIKEIQQEFFQELVRQQGANPQTLPIFFNFAQDFLQIETSRFIQALFSIPPYSLQLFAVTLFGTPLLLLVVHYDKLAQEISDGTFRYFLFRTSRAELYWSKMASAAIEIILVTFLATLLALIYGHFTLSGLETARAFKASFTLWAVGLPFLFAFSSLVLCFSAAVKRPFTALLFSTVAIVAAGLVIIWAPWLSPFHLEYWKGFFLPGTSLMWRSILVYLGLATFLSGLGFLIFKKRDL